MEPPRMPDLVEELVGEVLLRIPPTNPVYLFSAALVCKRWCRLLSDPAFRRRYCHFHRAPPLLGFVNNFFLKNDGIPPFTPFVASPCSPPVLYRDNWWALDCRHGRVLIYSSVAPTGLVVWDPITSEQKRLPLPPYPYIIYTGAVLCAVAGCNHLNCNGGPFLVVFVGSDEDSGSTWASVYSSETASWGATSSIVLESHISKWPSLRIGNVLYFNLGFPRRILRFDLAVRDLSVIDAPGDEDSLLNLGTVMMMDGGRLGYAGLDHDHLYLWSWQEQEAAAGWKLCKVIELVTLLRSYVNVSELYACIVGFVDGTDTIFLSTVVGIFTLKVKSELLTKVGEPGAYYYVFSYSGFYTPRLERLGLKSRAWTMITSPRGRGRRRLLLDGSHARSSSF